MAADSPRVVSINISTHKGTKKRPIAHATLHPDHGLVGDAHAGSWHRQVSLLSVQSIDKVRSLGLASVMPGDFAENITTSGLTLHTLPVGARLTIGAAVLEVTQIGKECHQRCEIFHAVGDCVMPREGIFAKVIQGAEIKVDDPVFVDYKTV